MTTDILNAPTTQGIDLLSPVWAQPSGVQVDRGDGIYLYDTEGNRYTDFTSGIGVTNTGHCHPRVVKAVKEQAERLLFGQINCVTSSVTLELARTLLAVMPEGLDRFYFSNSGAEAVEASIKLARAATGRPNIISFEGSFHGRTAMAMALTGSKTLYRSGYQPLPAGIFFTPFPNAYRYGWDQETTISFCLEQLNYILKTQSAPEETAAILIEPVQGEGGYVPAPAAFLRALRAKCDEHGILLITDEIQSGFGRTGRLWAHQHGGIVPDILIMAKGIASGLPMSAIAASGRLMEKWKPGTHGGTYGGGSAVVMAAAIATIQTILEEKLTLNAEQQGNRLFDRILQIALMYPVIGDVRGLGLMVGIEFTTDGKPDGATAKKVAEECIKNRLLVLTCGLYGNVLRLIPPLIITPEQVDSAADVLEKAIEKVVGL